MGHTISRSYWIRKYEVGLFGDVCDLPVPTVNTSQRDAEIILDCLFKDSSLSSRDIHIDLKEDGATFGLTTKWTIEASGFTHPKPRFGQMVRDVNKVKRVDFCHELISSNDTFDNVIFSDECSVQLNQNKTYNYRPKDSYATVLPKPKHTLKIHVWAAISKRDASIIKLFEGIMDAEFYTTCILYNTLMPFIEREFGETPYRFQQDNDPKRISRRAWEFMRGNGISWWNVWPAGYILTVHVIKSLWAIFNLNVCVYII